jgi:hypothetical protein
MAKNAHAIDRMIPEDVGGYPVNYGFVPQTVSYDGDPFDCAPTGTQTLQRSRESMRYGLVKPPADCRASGKCGGVTAPLLG